MDRDDLRGPDLRALGSGYRTQPELLRDLMSWTDLLLYYYYIRHQWVGPDSDLKNMLGLVVSREEFEYNLSRAAERGLWARLDEGEREQAQLTEQALALRLERTDAPLPLLLLFSRCGLDSFEQKCLVLSYLPCADRKYGKLFAYLQDDVTCKAPGAALAVQLFLPPGEEPETCMSRFSRRGDRDRFLRLFDADALGQGLLVPRRSVTEFLATGTLSDRAGLRLFDGGAQQPRGPLAVQRDTARRLDALVEDPAACTVLLSGPAGSGKRFQVEHLCSRRRERCVFADLEGEGWQERAGEAALWADMCDAWLCLYRLDRDGDAPGEYRPPDAGMLEALEQLGTRRNKRFFLSRKPITARLDRLAVEVSLPEATEQERLELFRSALRGSVLDGCTEEELAAKFRFSPRQIRVACEQAAGLARLEGTGAIPSRLMHRCCYAQAVHSLEKLASRVPPAYGWDDVVLPEAQKRLMRQACDHIRYRHRVYYDWGFGDKVSYGRGLSILFAGAPGTGKTMCAQVIANQLDMELFKINLSQIVSKYIGETEKNLRSVFSEAKNAGCILFFDECDALFGKRSEVKDAHDRNANVEVAYLLQQIEEYDGVCILATNLIGNIDAAFMRRITYVVHFPFPDPPARERIYRRMLPDAAPRADDIDWRFLAEKFELSGGHIKNIVLSAAFMAAGEDAPVSMRHLLQAAVNELKKNEIVVVREQLREYADLLSDGGAEQRSGLA